jgi:formylglycine-generating enzyme required for sulfatase activity
VSLGKLVRIPAGSFTMGSPASESGRDSDENPVSVRLTTSYLMMESEVTQGMWQAVMGNNPSSFSGCGSSCPVEQVSWLDAVAFANAVSAREGLRPAYQVSGESVSWDRSANGYRLPTEAEWEYAARGGQSYVYAGSNSVDAVAWYGANSGSTTHPVCQKQRNGYGLCDLTGNVWEWTWDWYGGPLTGGTDPQGSASGSSRVNRGGSWDYFASNVRVANRRSNSPGNRNDYLGFRLVRPVP